MAAPKSTATKAAKKTTARQRPAAQSTAETVTGMSMADLMASPDVGLPESTFPICVAGKLADALDAATQALFDTEAQVQVLKEKIRENAQAAADGQPGQRRRLAQKSHEVARLAELEQLAEEQAAAADAIRDKVQAHTVAVHLRALPPGEWRTWVDEHPARDRDEDRAGYDRDIKYAQLHCNIDDIADEAHLWVTAYGEEQPTAKMWEFLAANASAGDLTRLASEIVGLHERVVDAGKSRRVWLESRRAGDVSK